jgi:hypothetical protein
MTRWAALLVGFVVTTPALSAPQTDANNKVGVVAVTGCLKQQGSGNDWLVVNATDPVPSRGGTPQANELPKDVVLGKNQFKLIGVAEFNLGEKKDKAVIVKGLYLKGTPVGRLNITSVTVVSPSCPAK